MITPRTQKNARFTEHWLLKTDPLQFTAEFTTNTPTHIITNTRMRKHSEELRATEEIRSIRRKTWHDPTPRTQEHETHWSRHARKNTRFADHGFTEKSSNPPRNTPLTHPRNINRGRWCENTRSTKTGFSQMIKKKKHRRSTGPHYIKSRTTLPLTRARKRTTPPTGRKENRVVDAQSDA